MIVIAVIIVVVIANNIVVVIVKDIAVVTVNMIAQQMGVRHIMICVVVTVINTTYLFNVKALKSQGFFVYSTIYS